MIQETNLSQELLQSGVAQINALRAEIARVVVGQERMITRLLVGLLTGGHILLEGAPGLAKTTAIKSLALALNAQFQRIHSGRPSCGSDRHDGLSA